MRKKSSDTTSRPWLMAVAGCLLLLGPSAAAGQAYVRADCKPWIASGPPADALTANWYRRFWTGDCGALSGCVKGSPNWNEVVGKLVARSAPHERSEVLAKSCRLGTLIGLEWTRPRAVRRVDSGDLRRFRSTLEKSGDTLRALEAVEDRARAKIQAKA